MDRPSIAQFRRSELFPPLLVLFAATVLYACPLFRNIAYWGKTDWDQFTFLNAMPREALLRYGQFPLWNPFSNGGNIILAMPHSAFLSPLFLLVLIFGPVVGLKLQWIVAVFLGLSGMYLLSRRLGMGPLSRFLPPAVFMLSSLYSLHLREGHLEWTSLGFLPWTVLFLLRARTEPRYRAFAVLSLALMIFSGGVYVFAASTVFLGVAALVFALQERRPAPVFALAGLLGLVCLVGSVKLVPMLELLRESPRPTKDEGRLEAVLLPKLFLLRDQNALYENRAGIPERIGMNWDRENWHEFGIYTGVIPLIFALAGFLLQYEKHRPVFWGGLACLWISMGRTAWFVDAWTLLHRLPVYRSLQVPSRFLMCVLFCVAIFAGLGFSELEKAAKKTYQKRLLAAVLLAVFLDLLAVNRPIVAGAFPIPPVSVERSAEFRQGGDPFAGFLKAGSHSAMYPGLLANRGTIKSYDIVGVTRGAVRNSGEPGYRGEAFLADGGKSARVAYFSPNKIVVEAEAENDGVLVLNQNYHGGWRTGPWWATRPALSRDGLIAAPVARGVSTVVFRYRPRSFLLGLLLTALGLAALIPFLRAR